MNSNSNSNSSSNNSNVEFHRRKTYKRRRYNNINNLSNNLNKMKLKKRVTFRHNKNAVYNVPKEAENIEARKSIVVNRTNRNNRNMYKNRKTPVELKVRGNTYRNYLNILRKEGKYHLNENNLKFLKLMTGNKN